MFIFDKYIPYHPLEHLEMSKTCSSLSVMSDYLYNDQDDIISISKYINDTLLEYTYFIGDQHLLITLPGTFKANGLWPISRMHIRPKQKNNYRRKNV